jgi:hypothetical protein
MNVVLDTCIFMREVATGDTDRVTAVLERAQHHMGVSEALLDEYESRIQALGGSFFVTVLTRLQRLAALGLVVRDVPARYEGVVIAVHGKDMHVVQCAIGTCSKHIVTRDNKHFGERAGRRDYLQSTFDIEPIGPGMYISRYDGAGEPTRAALVPDALTGRL